MDKAVLFIGNTPANIEELVWFLLKRKKSYVLLNYHYPTKLVFQLKKKYFMLWTNIEYCCLLAFVKRNLLRFCLLVFSPLEFFVIMFGYNNVNLSHYMTVPITVSQLVLITVCFFVLSESHWKSEKEVGCLSMIECKTCFPPRPF